MNTMTMAEYMVASRRTANHGMSIEARWPVTLLGLGGELGEIKELYKKKLGHGHGLPRDLLVKECGDLLWYIAEAAVQLGLKNLDCVPSPTTTALNYLRMIALRISDFEDCFLIDNADLVYHIKQDDAEDRIRRLYLTYRNFLAAVDLDFSYVAQMNIVKLAERFPQGFSHERSKNRAQ